MSGTYSGTTNVQSKQADIAISTVMLLFGASNICVNDVSNTRKVCTLSPTQFSVLCPGLGLSNLCLHTLKSCRGYSSSPCGCRFTSSTILCYRCTSRSCRGASSIILTCRGTFKLQLYHHINLLEICSPPQLKPAM